MFLGGLSPDTTKDDIKVVIEQFGQVNDVQIMTEKGTDKPRGFGFAILENYDDVDKLCIKKYHRIKVRLCVCEREREREREGGVGGERETDKGGEGGGRGGSL